MSIGSHWVGVVFLTEPSVCFKNLRPERTEVEMILRGHSTNRQIPHGNYLTVWKFILEVWQKPGR